MVFFYFFLATVFLFLQGVGLIPLPFHPYIPWIAFTILYFSYKQSVIKPLTGSMIAGLILDLLSNHPFGFHPISYGLAIPILVRYRNRFLYERPLHFVVFASFTSCVIFFFQLLFLFFFNQKIAIFEQSILIAWIVTTLLDGVYALIFFSGSMFLWKKANTLFREYSLK